MTAKFPVIILIIAGSCNAGLLKGIIMKIKWNTHFWWIALPIAGLVIWGALCITNNLWYDESYSAALISLPWKEMVAVTAGDDHSPFYYSLLKLFYTLFGGGGRFWSLKLLSLIFMMGYLFMGKYYVKKLFGEKVSVYFILFSVTMPIMAVQAGNVRMYAAGLFFLTLTGLTACDLCREATAKKWVVFCIASMCSVYCHTFSVIQTLFIYIFFFGVIIYRREYRKLKGFFVSGVLVALVYFPWLLVTWHQVQLRLVKGMRGGVGGSVPTMYTFMDYCMEWFSALETPITLVVFLGMGLTVFLGYYAVDWMRRNHDYAPGMGIAAIGLTTLTGVIVSIYVTPCFIGRYVFPGFGALALLYAVGFAQLSSEKLKACVLAVVFAGFFLQYRSELRLEYDPGLRTYQTFFEENVGEQDAMMGPNVHALLLSVYYPELQYFIYGAKPENAPNKNMTAFKEWEQLEEIEGNLWYIGFAGDSPYLLAERYDYEEALSFHYMYYDFAIYRVWRR